MSRTVSLNVLRVGWCQHLECMADRGGRIAPARFPALCGLIRHPDEGWILYDTGYAEHFFRATQRLPERLYRTAVPVQLPAAEQLLAQLHERGIAPSDIRTVIISHFHSDHVAGLRDFPQATFIALEADRNHIESLRKRRWLATLQGHLPALLPDDFAARLHLADACPRLSLPGWMKFFTHGLDLIGDGSLVGVPLPGHSKGQLGLFVPDAQGRPVFMVADACWSTSACRAGRLPAQSALWLTTNHQQQYRQTYRGIGDLLRSEHAIAVVPSHCNSAWENYCIEE
ncbi:MBL fold metallo-hydrolase [Pseudomonas sp. CCI3.2]|uniref:MBL fold metallo-hydrolase n=1 Tax=unclassified Pseudomonas TaxID=196821 RepID=UPI002AC9199D|nr:MULTISPECIES: MBL fold metallo-hydrolase [unclassified Pseudomonas]MEB0079636.1 MBL fold metallo-hydrolase [Pseudomonas sp. MH10out]MEB0103426.1 MBL fold metallo-hydrolase [Pseudomonas sp. CCI3.2]MEB0132221.1 MBL fold metallo-hydrolase [Pseudomonas sp. CCI2.4]MEB0157817.1 MBL fold metallo-hydrolase [Pseudomonas sp. AH2 (2023)]MEB0169336.1 MBL fold metallo-hydrolase [Pseudomonas sp. CCC4.4]